MTDDKIRLEPEDIFPHIVNMIKNKHLAVFFGSGACRSAGLPLASELRDKIISSLGLQSNQDSTLEQLLQQIKQRQGRDAFNIIIETLRDISVPSNGYRALAALVKHRLIRVIFTTNYDILLENALRGVIGEEFTVIASKQDFDNFTVNIESDKPVIFKLHGSINDESSIMGSWDEVQSFSKEKTRILLPYFQHYGFVFIGYACADEDVLSLIEYCLENRRDRKSYVITSSSPTIKIQKMLSMLTSSHNHLKMSSDDFLEKLLKLTMNIDESTQIPHGLIESNAREMFSRQIVKKMKQPTKEELQKQDIERLHKKIYSLMDTFAVPLINKGLMIYKSVRGNNGVVTWEGKSNIVSRKYIESIMNKDMTKLNFISEFEFEIRMEINGKLIMPILFSITDLFLLDDGELIAIWNLFISDTFPYGKSLDADNFKFSWSEDGFLHLESWISKKLNETIAHMTEAGSGKEIQHTD